MSEPKFTPGPWKADIRTGVYAVYPESEDHNWLSMTDLGTRWMVAYQMGRENRDNWPYPAVSDEQEANARLIAASPDLYAACKAALARLIDLGSEQDADTIGPCAATDACRSALRKAEGTA